MNKNFLGTARRAVLGFPLREGNYERGCQRRGIYPGVGLARQTLEEITRAVFAGFHTALETPSPLTLKNRLEKLVKPELLGFLYEGATMGLAVLDSLDLLRRDRFGAFLKASPTQNWPAFALGYGLASARIPWARKRILNGLHPFDSMSRWFVFDGFGFHDGMFRMKQVFRRQIRPSYLQGFAAQIYDQGLGRSLWFGQGADPSRVVDILRRFAPLRQMDLWAGVGFASSFAGGADEETLNQFATAAGAHRPYMAMGTALAASCRKALRNKPQHTVLACKTVCQLAFDEAAALVEECWSGVAERPEQPAYASCRKRLAESFTSLKRTVSLQGHEDREFTDGGVYSA